MSPVAYKTLDVSHFCRSRCRFLPDDNRRSAL
jgi:hypothetical protein